MNEQLTSPHVGLATPGTWQRYVHNEEVWATVVTIEVRGEWNESDAKRLRGDVAESSRWLHKVDDWFSTYRLDTPITAIRNGLMAEHEAPAIVRRVLAECRAAGDVTGGIFDPWCVPGGVDPSGYVKGWAADQVADQLVRAGWENVLVNASGDLACRGHQAPEQPWAIGIQHPEFKDQIVKVAHLSNQAMATSGRYERGNHILDPRSGRAALELDSATVIGPSGGLAEALATALVIVGADGAAFFSELDGWSAYLISGSRASYFGPAFEGTDQTDHKNNKEN